MTRCQEGEEELEDEDVRDGDEPCDADCGAFRQGRAMLEGDLKPFHTSSGRAVQKGLEGLRGFRHCACGMLVRPSTLALEGDRDVGVLGQAYRAEAAVLPRARDAARRRWRLEPRRSR